MEGICQKTCASEARFGQAREKPSRNGLLGLLRCFHPRPCCIVLQAFTGSLPTSPPAEPCVIPGNHAHTRAHRRPCYAESQSQQGLISAQGRSKSPEPKTGFQCSRRRTARHPTQPRSQDVLCHKVGSFCRCPTTEHAGPRVFTISCHRGEQTPQAPGNPTSVRSKSSESPGTQKCRISVTLTTPCRAAALPRSAADCASTGNACRRTLLQMRMSLQAC